MRCSVDGAAAVDCTSGLKLTELTSGEHQVSAVLVDASGRSSAATTYRWNVKRTVRFAARIARKGKLSKRNQAVAICKISGDTLKVCNVKVYARVGRKVAVIGTGRRVLKLVAPKAAAASAKPSGKPSIGVRITLNAKGRRLLAKRPKAIKVTVAAKGQPVASPKLASKVKGKLLPAKRR